MASGEKCKCVIILSSKSSGSSALQYLLTSGLEVRRLKHTRHKENETLFWVKAASVLGRPQLDMVDSEVPIPAEKARADLSTLISQNSGVDASTFTSDDDLVFQGWRALCEAHGPVFLEKSPHHIHQWSSLELILESAKRQPDIAFKLIGLVRNPMDTLYSMWTRWRSYPEATEPEWVTAYTNLLRLKELVPDLVHIVRYEDMVTEEKAIRDIFTFMGADAQFNFKLHRASVSKWRQDSSFGFTLSPDAIALAKQYGYAEHELTNAPKPLWSLRRRLTRLAYKTSIPVKRLARKTLKRR